MRKINLPSTPWVPGTVAAEYVQRRLAGDYSLDAVLELLSIAVNENTIRFRHRIMEDNDAWAHADSMGMPFWLKARDLQLKREDVIAWSDGLVSKTDDHQNEYNSDSLKEKERTTLLKLIIGMAVAGYKYDPEAKRSDATKDIADDLVSLGIPLDTDTVRKWLREAAQHLPHDRGANE